LVAPAIMAKHGCSLHSYTIHFYYKRVNSQWWISLVSDGGKPYLIVLIVTEIGMKGVFSIDFGVK